MALYELSDNEKEQVLTILDKATVQGFNGASVLLHLLQVFNTPIVMNQFTPDEAIDK